jgi:hypothetical protein
MSEAKLKNVAWAEPAIAATATAAAPSAEKREFITEPPERERGKEKRERERERD